MSRGPLALGTYGATTAKQQSNGKWRATTRYRDFDGVTRPVQAFGDTKNKAIARLRDNVQNRDGARSQDKLITRETRLTDLADLWLAELELDENIDPQTIAGYRKEIKVSTDKRANPKTVKIKSPKVGIGDLMVWEATTSRLDLYLKSIVAAGHKRKARIHKVILAGMLGLAVRHDAIPVNPFQGWRRSGVRRVNPARSNAKPSMRSVRNSASGPPDTRSPERQRTSAVPRETRTSRGSPISCSAPAPGRVKRSPCAAATSTSRRHHGGQQSAARSSGWIPSCSGSPGRRPPQGIGPFIFQASRSGPWRNSVQTTGRPTTRHSSSQIGRAIPASCRTSAGSGVKPAARPLRGSPRRRSGR